MDLRVNEFSWNPYSADMDFRLDPPTFDSCRYFGELILVVNVVGPTVTHCKACCGGYGCRVRGSPICQISGHHTQREYTATTYEAGRVSKLNTNQLEGR